MRIAPRRRRDNAGGMPSAKLTDEQIAAIHSWAAEGADLNVIQDRLKTELGITLTFMDTRFLVADLGVQLKPAASEEPEKPAGEEKAAADEFDDPFPAEDAPLEEPFGAGGGAAVKVTVDEIVIPGALASGKVTFSDGVTASWYFDQMGRLGLSGVDRTYQPSETDFASFQRQLQQALRKLGY